MVARAESLLAATAGRGPGLLTAAAGAGGLLGAFLAGVVMAAGASLFDDYSPIAMLVLALAPLLAFAIVIDPRVGVVLVFATFPVGAVGASLGSMQVQAAELAVLLIATVVTVRRLAVGMIPIPWHPVLWAALALLVWSLISFYTAVDQGLALKFLASLAGGLVFAAVVYGACTRLSDVRLLLGAMTLAGAVVGITALAGGAEFESTYGGSNVSGRLEGAFDSPNQLGSFCALLTPIAAAFVFAVRGTISRLLAAGALLLIVAALMLSLSRGAWLGVAVAGLYMLFKLREARRLLVALAVPALIAGVALSSVDATDSTELQVIGDRARAFTARNPYDGRSDIWEEARRQIKESPVTGQGPGAFPVVSVRADSAASSITPDHAHNLALNYAAETGLPGLAIVVAFVLAVAAAGRRAARTALGLGDRRSYVLVIGMLSGLLALGVQNFTVDYTFGNAVVHLLMWATIGLLLAAQSLLAEP
ncbi:MAG TPA: O-antigen ligase family protein [Gaiellaceae bacterium]|nr:O-antigen ligase family protein [Gaiellaceae bacterium]